MIAIRSSNQQLNFGVIPQAQWRCKSANNKIKDITIASFEKKDLPVIEKLLKKSWSICTVDRLKLELLSTALKTIRGILSAEDGNIDEKVKMLVALHEGSPCGLLIGNAPKYNNETKKICYSSRHNAAKKETELDWLVTWQSKGKPKIKGIGKALVAEYFSTIKKDKFRDVFVRSEVPEKSFAKSFYESMGFEQIGTKRLKLFNKNSAHYAGKDYTESNDDTIPMIATRRQIEFKVSELSKKMMRQEFKKNSVNADDLIKI